VAHNRKDITLKVLMNLPQPAHPNWQPTPVVSPWDDLLAGIRTPEDWAEKRRQIRTRFLSLLRDEAKPPLPEDLNLRIEAEWPGAGYRIRKISYQVEPDERAHAYLAIPGGSVPPDGFPAVLCVHGTTNWGARQTLGLPPEPRDPHGDRGVAGKDFARLLVQNGYVTLSPEHFCCAARCPQSKPYDTAAFYQKHPHWAATGKSTFENHIALNVLCSLPEVNRDRLGVTGHSLGGHNSIFLAAYDDRIKCAVPSCSGPTINENPEPLQWSRDNWYVYFPHLREQFLRGERIACDFHEMMALAAPTPLLEFLALNDGDPRMQAQRVLLHNKVHEVYRILGHEDAHAFLVFGDGHSMPDLTRAALLSWFDRWLKHNGKPLGGWHAPY